MGAGPLSDPRGCFSEILISDYPILKPVIVRSIRVLCKHDVDGCGAT